MDWTRFKTHGDSPDQAFEAFTGLLFERWSRREYRDQIDQIIFVNGAGGDGGVEAYTILSSGDLIGMQCKWFQSPLKADQFSQIRQSLDAAVQARPGLYRYIVAVPRNLGDHGQSSRKRQSERGRWDAFKNAARGAYPQVEIELWDELHLTELLSELGSSGLERYWFDRTAINIESLKRRFEQAQESWLRDRYSCDIHQQGKINADLDIRLSTPSRQQTWLLEIRKCLQRLRTGREAVNRLHRLKECVLHHDLVLLSQSTLDWFDEAIKEEEEIERIIQHSLGFPILQSDRQSISIAHKVFDLLEILENQGRPTSRTNPVEPIYKELLSITELWSGRIVTFEFLRRYGQSVLHIGEPGSGKTHAFTNAVEGQLANKAPAVLIRARNVDVNSNWTSILSNAIGEPNRTLEEMLDAIEAATIQAGIRAASESDRSGPLPSYRALIAVDGLDETPSAAKCWQEKIGEIIPLSKEWPRVLFAFSLRTSLASRIQIHPNVDQIHIQQSDVPLPMLFHAHCRVSHIICPPLLRWALRSPLEIKLFADVYQDCKLTDFAPHEFSLEQLIVKKLEHVERLLLNIELGNLYEQAGPLRAVLRAIVRTCLKLGRAISSEEALQTIEETLSTKGVLNRRQLLEVMHHCCDNGLLLKFSTAANSPLEDDVIQWELTYQSITDYFLAYDVVETIRRDGISQYLPDYLINHRDAIQIAVLMLGNRGYRFLELGIWAGSLNNAEREELQLAALVSMPSQLSETYREWVSEVFIRNMPSCRLVLHRLILPNLRLQQSPFGARFVHELLLPWQVADRDLFWSGPDYLPYNCGGKWEGRGERVLENLQLEVDEPWDSAPLLLAWGTTSVNNEQRRSIRAELAQWAKNKPTDLLLLLQTVISTNDPQMKEDVLLAAYGAACLTKLNQDWKPICDWLLMGHFGKQDERLKTYDVVVRHAIYGIVERALVCGIQLSETELAIYQNSQRNANDLLPIDQAAVMAFDEHHGVEPAKWDLAWYVIPNATEPFFSESLRPQSEDTEIAPLTYLDIDVEILREVAKGRLRPNIDEQIRKQISSVILVWEAITASEQNNLAQLLDDVIILVSNESENNEQSADVSASSTEMTKQELRSNSISDSVNELIEKHRLASGITELSPGQFAFGFVAAFVKAMGWSEDLFRGQPDGGKPGELLGPDIAIIRLHSWARHGERSTVSSFAEKYVWTAVEHLSGYLAEHLPVYLNNKKIDPPIPPMLLSDITSPAADVYFDKVGLDFNTQASILSPNIKLYKTRQIECANEWIETAPLPDFTKLLVPQNIDISDSLADQDWLLLRLLANTIHTESQATTIVAISALTLPSNILPLLAEDVQVKALRSLHECQYSTDRIESYVDPSEVVWASWYHESYGSHSYVTLDNSGQPVNVSLLAASSSFYWDSPEGEREEWIPSQWLRKALNIVDYRDGRFFNAAHEIVGHQVNHKNKNNYQHHFHALYVSRDKVLRLIEREQKTMVWGIGCWREPSSPLYKKSWPIVRLDWRGIALPSSKDSIEIITQSQEIKRFVASD